MSLSLDNILQAFIDVARDGIGSQLSTIGPTGTEFPAVIKERQDGPRPEFPYATVTINAITDNGEWQLQEYLDQSNNDLVYESNKSLSINYRVYGGNAIQIANDLHGYFRVDSALDFIRTQTGGAVVEVFAVDSLPQVLSDSFLETASILINFAITDTLRITDDNNENYFDHISADGEAFDGEGDPNPLPITVTAP